MVSTKFKLFILMLLCAFGTKAQSSKAPVSLLGTWIINVGEPTDSPEVYSFHLTIWRIHSYDDKTKILSLTESTVLKDKSRSISLKRNLKATFSKTSVTIELGETWGNKIVTIELVNVDKDNGLKYVSPKLTPEGVPIASIYRISTISSELIPAANDGEIEIKIAPPPPLPPTKTSKP